MEEQLRQIEAESERVAREHAEHEAAISAERDAEAAVLERVIAIARPALRAISDRVESRIGEMERRRNNDDHDDDREPRYMRAAYLHDRKAVDRQAFHTQSSTSVDGDALLVRSDGMLVRGRYQGCTSQWADRGRYWLVVEEITARQAMDTYDLACCVRSILRALTADRRADETKAARERTAKLAGILALL